MASGDIHVTVTPALSTTTGGALSSIGGNADLFALFINEQQAAEPAKSLFTIMETGPRPVLVFKED